MIAYVKGIVAAAEEKAVVVEVHGIGYRVTVGGALLHTVVVGQEITLYTHHHVSDSEQALFGFVTMEDLDYFRLLLTVPSIGPKTAMGVLDAAPPKVLEQAIHTKDMLLLTKISGVGKRTAERILVELGGKLKGKGSTDSTAMTGSLQHETVEALIAIGFKPKEARDKVAHLPSDVRTVEEAVKAALKTHVRKS